MKNKKAQELKSKILSPMPKKAQEEMVGFALIIIIVAIILLIFLGNSLRNSQEDEVEDYEVSSFIQSFLQYTTECEKNSESLSIQQLIFECEKETLCSNEEYSCEMLSKILKNIAKESWNVGEDEFVKGYNLEILFNGEELEKIIEGEESSNYRTSVQNFAKSGDLVEIFFTAYY